MKVIGNTAERMEKVNLITQMVTYMKVILQMEKWKVGGIIPLKMEINMKGHGKMIK